MSAKNFILGIAIIIITITAINYGISTFYSEPDYVDFCGEYKTQEIIETQSQCETIGGMWNSYENIPKPLGEPTVTGYCDRDFTCRQEYETAREKYSKNIFFITFPIGILIIILGTLTFNLESVGAGLMGGGLGTIIYGITSYWQYSQNWLKFLFSIIALAILIWLAYYFNKKVGKKKR